MYMGENSRDEWFNDCVVISGDELGETSERNFFVLFVGDDSEVFFTVIVGFLDTI